MTSRTRAPSDRDRQAVAFGHWMKPSHAANDNLIHRTRRVWQPRTGRNITEEDARQIVENVTGFFAILAGWSRAELSAPANDTGKPIASGNKEADHER